MCLLRKDYDFRTKGVMLAVPNKFLFIHEIIPVSMDTGIISWAKEDLLSPMNFHFVQFCTHIQPYNQNCYLKT